MERPSWYKSPRSFIDAPAGGLDCTSSMEQRYKRGFRSRFDRAFASIDGRDFDAFGQPLQVYAKFGDKAEVFVDGVPVENVSWADARRGIICSTRGGDHPSEWSVRPDRVRIECTALTYNANAAKAHILAESIGGTVTYEA